MSAAFERLPEVVDFYADPGEADALAESVRRRLAERLARSGKTCVSCRETKPLDAFGFSAREKDGLRPVCLACRRV
jgi:hypothetical protein